MKKSTTGHDPVEEHAQQVSERCDDPGLDLAREYRQLLDGYRALSHKLYKTIAISDHYQRQLKEMTVHLKAAQRDAEEANRAKSLYLGIVSHEMRTPLTGIMACADILAASGLTGEQQRYVALFRETCETLDSLIDDLLDLSAIEAGRIDLQPSTFLLSELLDNIQLLFAGRFAAKGVQLKFHRDPALPREITSDRRRLGQILLNLIANALKFTDRGAVELFCSLGTADGAGRLRIAVRDSGVGIAEEEQQRIFAPFVSLTQGRGGIGLGLTVSRRLIERLGGELTVESSATGGSTFAFSLPLPELETTSPPVAERPSPKRLLLVDSSPGQRELIREALDKFNCRLVATANGTEALQLLHADRFDGLILSLHLPDMLGTVVVREVRRREGQLALPRLPIVVLTGGGNEIGPEEIRLAGSDHVLPGPLRKEKLLRLWEAIFRATGS